MPSCNNLKEVFLGIPFFFLFSFRQCVFLKRATQLQNDAEEDDLVGKRKGLLQKESFYMIKNNYKKECVWASFFDTILQYERNQFATTHFLHQKIRQLL